MTPPTQTDLSQIGYWSEIKIEIVRQYAQAFSTILAAQRKPEIAHMYIDAFSGSGLHIAKEKQEIVLGSPMSVLSVKPAFHEYHFIDLDQGNINTLRQLTSRDGLVNPNVYCYVADCNKILLTEIFPRARFEDYRRALCLLDPFGLHLEWEVIKTAGEMRSVDIVLNFPILDMNRNVLHRNRETVDGSQVSRMTKYWGDDSWEKIAYSSERNLFGYEEKASSNAIVHGFVERLRSVAQFKHVSDPLPMRNSTGGIVYYLIIASQKEAGVRIANSMLRKYRNRNVR